MNGESVYFSSFDEEGNLQGFTTKKDSVEVVTGYGTGFFISPDGEIATNAHVVSNTVADKEVNKSIANVISALKKVIVAIYNEYNEKFDRAQLAYDYANKSSDVSYETFSKVRD